MIDEGVKFVGYSCWLLIVGVTVITKQPMVLYTGITFCQIAMPTATVGIVHGFFGGTGIALMRIIFIKFPSKVTIGQMTIALLISFTTLTLSASATYIWITSPKLAPDLEAVCLGRSYEMHRVIFHIKSDQSVIYEQRIITRGLVGLGLLLLMTELAIYTSIYKFLDHHDKNMRIVLSENIINQRKRKNVIDLTGHSLNFAFEMFSLVISIGFPWIPTKHRWVFRCYYMGIYGLLSMMHIAFSKPLKRDCILMWEKLSESLSMILASIFLKILKVIPKSPFNALKITSKGQQQIVSTCKQ